MPATCRPPSETRARRSRDAREEIATLRAGIAGRVRIGAGPAWERSVLPQAIALFTAERPGVQLHVGGGADDALKAQLRAGELDSCSPRLRTHPSSSRISTGAR